LSIDGFVDGDAGLKDGESSVKKLDAGNSAWSVGGKSSETGRIQKILWEAAWREIESNIEEYVNRFADARGSDVDDVSKEVLWREIVELERERRELKRESMKTDGKGIEWSLV
jgi:intein-encoded DNA endonuclease-like protein